LDTTAYLPFSSSIIVHCELQFSFNKSAYIFTHLWTNSFPYLCLQDAGNWMVAKSIPVGPQNFLLLSTALILFTKVKDTLKIAAKFQYKKETSSQIDLRIQ